ncbi:PREDICTED: uncharacterized protein LOC18603945 [Theobroma cacao]|uniref:Uncharacterized protein LOC18603945 n=1 Tax=Theobroma cacao TaxID=3641 RepID=A0AB32X2J5_THECC|nr:PREDICTED: uncharacterized protein LOC18603945 [Theobroma cacao]
MQISEEEKMSPRFKAFKIKSYLKAFNLWDTVETRTEPVLRNANPTIAQLKQHEEDIAKRSCNQLGHVEKVCKNKGATFDEKATIDEKVEASDEVLFMVMKANPPHSTGVTNQKFRFVMVKSETLKNFLKFRNLMENQANSSIKILKSDNGNEFTFVEFERFLSQLGISHQLTVTYNPQQNGVYERKNKTVMELTRCLLFQKGLPKSFWVEAVNTTNYLLNLTLTRALGDKTP